MKPDNDVFVIWSEEDNCYVGLSHSQPLLSYLAKSQMAAWNGIRGLVRLAKVKPEE